MRAGESFRMKSDQEIRDYITAHPTYSVRRIQSNLRCNGITREHIRSLMPEGAGPVPPILQKPKTVTKPLKALLEEFDDISKVRKAMKDLSVSEVIEDEELRRMLRISSTRWREVRGHNALSEYLFRLPNNRYVWMHREAQEKLQAAINLSST